MILTLLLLIFLQGCISLDGLMMSPRENGCTIHCKKLGSCRVDNLLGCKFIVSIIVIAGVLSRYSARRSVSRKHFPVHSPGGQGVYKLLWYDYQEIHSNSAMNIDSVKIDTSLIMMREWIMEWSWVIARSFTAVSWQRGCGTCWQGFENCWSGWSWNWCRRNKPPKLRGLICKQSFLYVVVFFFFLSFFD